MIEPLVFGNANARVLGVLHRPPSSRARDAGIVICAPIGYENVCAYRPLRTLANQLAASGRPTLRFDLPGIGDSPGDEFDTCLVERWVNAIEAAVHELRRVADVRTVALVGVRLGATLAAVAAARDLDLSELVLWAPFKTGSAYAREMRAFHALAEREFDRPERPQSAFPDGAMEVSGFVLADSTLADLGGIDLTSINFEGSPPARVLLADRATAPSDDDPTVENLRAHGVVVTTTALEGLEEVVAKSRDGLVPQSAFDSIDSWLDVGQPAKGLRALARSNARLELEVDGTRIAEEPVLPLLEHGLFAITSIRARAEAGSAATWMVFVNTGGTRRIGPNRMWTTFSRSLASRGLPCLRLDVRGAGDSDGEYGATLEAMYDPGAVDDVGLALDHLREHCGAKRFIFVGLCSGAHVSLHSAARDEDIVGAALVNISTLNWTPDDTAEREKYVRLSPFRRSRWQRLLEGSVSPLVLVRAVMRTGRVAAHWALMTFRRRLQRSGAADPAIVGLLERTVGRGCRILFVFSRAHAGLDYLEWKLGPGFGGLAQRETVTFTTVAGPDHTFRPYWSHAYLLHLIEEHAARCGHPLDHAVEAA